MADNPYAPPKALVADPSDGVDSFGGRPREVTLAAQLLWAALAIGVVNTVIDAGPAALAGSLSPAYLAGSLVTLAFLASLTYHVARGRNWARIVFLVLLLLGLLGILLVWPALPIYPVPVMVMSSLITVLQVVAVYLVFTGNGARWFRRRKSSSEGVA